MKVKIEEKPAFTAVGFRGRFTSKDGANFRDIPKMWDNLSKHDYERLLTLSDVFPQTVLGICANEDSETETFDYWIAGATTAQTSDLEQLSIGAATYAVFAVEGAQPAAVQKAWQDIFAEWLPNSDYKIANGPQIEYNPDGDAFAEDYYCEIWLPVVKKMK
ncbi:GyrI-like domain-containing protein [Lactococcus protaetiae]|uniref:AraC family transcriptional regulator n=1 Tax=Lactococcus protaetiae TaxID=2592653 RepID=A0A514Z741_9LACT|nr:GyrI-like domain-containing protein [Lactococcus protaetiae]QDK70418.1 AraC family transcriptional regulator [Lactococcus protaetiae]